jgi:hypothetical protein
MTTKIATILLFGAVLLVFSEPCLAQQKESTSHCSTVYENHNQIDYGPLKVGLIEGTSVIQLAPPLKGALTEADSEGRFELRVAAPGRYRLVARAEGLCTANIPLEVVKSSSRKAEIVVYFRPTGIDICSTGELAVPKKNSPKHATMTRNPKATTP